MQSELRARYAGREDNPLRGIGGGRDGTTRVRLVPGAAAIAAELKAEYGERVSLVVGFKRFPPDGTHPPPHQLPEETGGQDTGLRVTCTVADARIAQGDSGRGDVEILNRGDARVDSGIEAPQGWLCVPGTRDVVGGFSGAIAGTGHRAKLDPGDSTTLKCLIGTASLEANDQYVVAPGTYELVVPVSMHSLRGREKRVLLARDCFVEVVEPGR